jgi:hypothetical protein
MVYFDEDFIAAFYLRIQAADQFQTLSHGSNKFVNVVILRLCGGHERAFGINGRGVKILVL